MREADLRERLDEYLRLGHLKPEFFMLIES